MQRGIHIPTAVVVFCDSDNNIFLTDFDQKTESLNMLSQISTIINNIIIKLIQQVGR